MLPFMATLTTKVEVFQCPHEDCYKQSLSARQRVMLVVAQVSSMKTSRSGSSSGWAIAKLGPLLLAGTTFFEHQSARQRKSDG